MAIIDDIKGTLTKTGKAAAKKTKDLAGIAKLSADIEETKSLITAVYAEIGKKYCETHDKETAEDSFTVDIATVENLKEQLEALKAERLKLRGKVTCAACEKAVDMDYVFCPFCGAKLPEAENDEAEEAKDEVVEVADSDEEITEEE